MGSCFSHLFSRLFSPFFARAALPTGEEDVPIDDAGRGDAEEEREEEEREDTASSAGSDDRSHRSHRSDRSHCSDRSASSVLGRGGFSVVYAERADDGTRVAVKRFFSASALRHEAWVLAQLRHPHVPSLLGVRSSSSDADAVDDELVLTYAGSTCLVDWLRHPPPPPPSQRRTPMRGRCDAVLLCVAEALRYLHDEKRIAHMDVKCDNVVVDVRTGSATLVDYNLSQSVDAGPPSRCGSAAYAAPEILTGVRRRGTHAGRGGGGGGGGTQADMWSLGVVAFALLYRRLPFASSDARRCAVYKRFSMLSLLHPSLAATAALRGAYSHPSFLDRPCVTDAHTRVVDACLRVHPESRPRARDVARAARDLLPDT